ncbi:MAG: hypothetical protein ABW215_08775 [Kibdelosporangium sp.]
MEQEICGVLVWDGSVRPSHTPAGGAQPMSRRRKPARPATTRAIATTDSHTIGSATEPPPCSLGTWVNGEMSIAHCGSRSNGPSWPSSRKSVSAAQLPITYRGAMPNSAKAIPVTTSVAGSCTSAAFTTFGSCPPMSSTCAPYVIPMANPATANMTNAPSAANTKWLNAHRVRPTPVASTGSARTLVSSDRSRSVACTP